ncbi:MAG: proteasome assembly chaperone family protein [Candidatus Hydrothermarchaeota archaeon]|nr:MAG: proteasome assembly chaperone family protein [Candidatus Hydrothermarchaeota archaeon]RLG59764.1 MAG: proteasome assembly chaperone family protein [Candidatus Hydrothermarchaeota archaeon]
MKKVRRVEFKIKFTQKPEVENPILIEGLPGIGHVGRIAATYLCKELRAKKFAILYSCYFPPQVSIDYNGIVQPMKNEFYYWKAKEKNQRDLIILLGNTQSSSPEGQYYLANKILEIAKENNVELIYTLGGVGVGKTVEKPRVFGATTSKEFIPKLEELGVIMKRSLAGQIIGVSGLLLPFGKLLGIKGICLMGETSGFYLDPVSAQKVLEVLCKLINVEIDMTRLAKKAKLTEKRVEEAQRMERKIMEEMGILRREPTIEDLKYIG